MTQGEVDFQYIIDHTDNLVALLALAEEANELSQAALKYARALELVKHPTPVNAFQAVKNMHNELNDVNACMRVITAKGLFVPNTTQEDLDKRFSRWADRLREAEKNG